jgi:hypothetical protein
VSAAALVVLLVVELRRREPLVDIRLLHGLVSLKAAGHFTAWLRPAPLLYAAEGAIGLPGRSPGPVTSDQ